MMLVVKITYTDAAGDLQTLLVSTHPYSDPELGDALPRLVRGSEPEYRARRNFTMWGQQSGHATFGAIEFINVDGAFDEWIDGVFRDHIWELRTGDEEHDAQTPFEDLQLHFRPTVENVVFKGDQLIEPQFRNSGQLVKGAVQVNEYGLDTPNSNLRGTLKPMIIGVPEHIPTDLFDEDHEDGERFFVADNFNGTLFTEGHSAGCKEGLATIPLGTDPGEYQEWRHGFDVNKHPTLPLTCLFPKGPRKRLIPWLSAHLAEWTEESGHTVPAAPWVRVGVNNGALNERWMRRYQQTDSLHFFSNAGISSPVRIRYTEQHVTEGRQYTVRLYVAPNPEFSNRARFAVSATTSAGAFLSTVVSAQYVDWADAADSAGRVEFTTSTTPSGTETLDFFFYRHEDDATAADPSELRILRIQVLPVVESGGGSLADIMHRANELIPYLLLERGRKMIFADLPPDFEQGPLHPAQIEYQALDQVTAEYPLVRLGWWWNDSATHEQLLNRIMTSHNAAWGFDRQDRFTAAVLRSPEYFTGTEPSSPPIWDQGGQQVTIDIAASKINVNSPVVSNIDDLLVLLIWGHNPAQSDIEPFFVTSDFVFSHNANAAGPAGGMISVYYKISDGLEPSAYTITIRPLAPFGVSLSAALVGRIVGADKSNPISIHDSVSGSYPLALELDVSRDSSLVIGFGNWSSSGFDPQPIDTHPGNELFSYVHPSGGTGFTVTEELYDSGPTGPMLWDGPEVGGVGAFSINAELPIEAEIFSDRFEVAEGSLSVENDNAPGLSTLMAIRRNFRPMGEGEVAELNVPSWLRTRYRREWIQVLSGGNNHELHPMYRHAINAPPLETMIVSTINVQEVVRSRVRVYNRPRRFWSYTHLGNFKVFSPGEPGHLTFNRYGLKSGKQYIAFDVRHLPMSGRQQIVGWG